MNELLKQIKKNWYSISVFFVVLLAFSLRFYNYDQRWALGGDQAHFVLESRYAIESFQLPMLGPFSSAGPFQTGGEWYWIVMLGSFWAMNWIIAPWVFLSASYVLFVFGMIVVGKELKGKLFGLLLGLLSAVSTAQISQSVSLSNQTPISLFALLAVLFMIKYLKTKKIRYFAGIALAIGTASSIHLQGIALVPFLAIVAIFEFPGIKGVLLGILGLGIPWLPVFYIDLSRNFENTRNMIYYFLFEKNKAPLDVLGRNWKNFTGVFIPTAWASIIGGNILIGYVLFILSPLVIFYCAWKKKIEKEWIIIFVSILPMLVILRYTHTPLFESFYVFLHVFILLITGWVLFSLYQWKKIIAVILLTCIVFFSVKRDIMDLINIKADTNPQRAYQQSKYLIEKFPGKKFAIYDYKFLSSPQSQSLSFFLDTKGKVDDSGMEIGYATLAEKGKFQNYLLPQYDGDYLMIDMKKLPNELRKEKWVSVTPRGIYNSGQNWYKMKQE